MEFLIVTGLSGAGKSRVVDALEDIGYYCVDNMPPQLLPKFAELCLQSREDVTRVAMVVDVRSGKQFLGLAESLDRLKSEGAQCQLLFLDCDDDVLLNRYKETRRHHPLADRAGGSLPDAVALERKALEPARVRADYRIDTSLMSPTQLKERVTRMFLDRASDSLLIECMSFGFKYGVPAEADLVLDVRCFPNPFYVPELKTKTGLDKEVQDYVMNSDDVQTFFTKLREMVTFLLPLYCKEGKSQLVIAIGCTGGKHRSVTLARELALYLRTQGYQVRDHHRDIHK